MIKIGNISVAVSETANLSEALSKAHSQVMATASETANFAEAMARAHSQLKMAIDETASFAEAMSLKNSGLLLSVLETSDFQEVNAYTPSSVLLTILEALNHEEATPTITVSGLAALAIAILERVREARGDEPELNEGGAEEDNEESGFDSKEVTQRGQQRDGREESKRHKPDWHGTLSQCSQRQKEQSDRRKETHPEDLTYRSPVVIDCVKSDADDVALLIGCGCVPRLGQLGHGREPANDANRSENGRGDGKSDHNGEETGGQSGQREPRNHEYSDEEQDGHDQVGEVAKLDSRRLFEKAREGNRRRVTQCCRPTNRLAEHDSGNEDEEPLNQAHEAHKSALSR
jgi:hypothetical protein